MTTTKQCCGNCHWFKAHGKSPLGGCEAPIPESAYSRFWVDTGHGEHCPTFRQRGERLPQRFRYRLVPDGEWSYGVCWWNGRLWHIRTQGGGHSCVKDGEDPTQLIALICCETHCVEWIDRDYGWEDVTA